LGNTVSRIPDAEDLSSQSDDNGNLFNLTRKLTSLSMANKPKSELIMNNQKLDFSDVPMIKAMASPDISKIELMGNKLEGPDISELINHLEINLLRVLTTLNLAENKIGDIGATAISNYLIEPQCKLQSLTVSFNNISDKGGVQLAQGLGENSSLELLNMDCNNLTDITLAEIERALTANPKCPLFNLSIAESEPIFTKSGAKLLWKLMSHNPKLTITGDPPFSLSFEIIESRKYTKPRPSKEKTSREELDVFHQIAVESINRMRIKSASPPFVFPD
jgi:hypothetical protein